METGIRALNALLMIVLRWFAYRFIVPGARTWPQGPMLGAGHGGAEAIILGGLAGYSLVHAIAAPALEGVLGCLGVASVAIVVALRPAAAWGR